MLAMFGSIQRITSSASGTARRGLCRTSPLLLLLPARHQPVSFGITRPRTFYRSGTERPGRRRPAIVFTSMLRGHLQARMLPATFGSRLGGHNIGAAPHGYWQRYPALQALRPNRRSVATAWSALRSASRRRQRHRSPLAPMMFTRLIAQGCARNWVWMLTTSTPRQKLSFRRSTNYTATSAISAINL